MNDKSFSIAMSVYQKDNAAFFDRALQSITEEQTVKPTEIVLVCDGPLNDKLNDIIEKHQRKYPVFKLIRLPVNKGLGNALKLAVENASHELIARMDSDDVSVADRFEQQLSFFNNHPEVDIVGGDITEFIGKEDNIIGRRPVPTDDVAIKEYMKKRCAMNHVSVMFKKQSVQAAGGYLDWFWNEDYYLWIRMLLNGAVFANTGTVLVNARAGDDMYARRGGDKYYKSEIALQKLMYNNKIISCPTYFSNCVKRFAVQKLLSNRARAWVYKTFARN